MSENLFYKSFFIIQYILGNKINAIILVNIYTIRYGFINKKFSEVIYQMFKIKS